MSNLEGGDKYIPPSIRNGISDIKINLDMMGKESQERESNLRKKINQTKTPESLYALIRETELLDISGIDHIMFDSEATIEAIMQIIRGKADINSIAECLRGKTKEFAETSEFRKIQEKKDIIQNLTPKDVEVAVKEQNPIIVKVKSNGAIEDGWAVTGFNGEMVTVGRITGEGDERRHELKDISYKEIKEWNK